jgi:hypothetical protein
MSLVKKIVLCSCNSTEHQILFLKFEDEPETVYMQIHLSGNKSILGRIGRAIKYVFGYKSRFGDWDDFILEKEQLAEMRQALTNVLTD